MKTRLEWRVGLFVAIGLVLLGVLMVGFSKGLSLFRPAYTILLRSSDVAGLKPQSAVLMAGVQVGKVSEIHLSPDGRSVTMRLSIYRDTPIHTDARFSIEQSGFLGDQYVAVTPTANAERVFENGEIAQAEPPFSFTETARDARNLVARVEQTAQSLTEAIGEVRRLVLNEQTLTNLSVVAENLRSASLRADVALEGLEAAVEVVNGLLETNGPAISLSGSNLAAFSQDIRLFAGQLRGLLDTNTPRITATLEEIEASAKTLRGLLADVEEGKGSAGLLLRDETMAANLSRTAEHLSITTSNLNRLGLWGILWKKKTPVERSPREQPLHSPKHSKP